MARLNEQVLLPLTSYRIPAIRLTKGTSKDAVATVFEKVNRGGLQLDVFELLTATFAGDRRFYEAPTGQDARRSAPAAPASRIPRKPARTTPKNTVDKVVTEWH